MEELEFIRAWFPEDLGEEPCVICKQPFIRESVILMGDEGYGTCPSCIEYLGRRNPERFPSIEEYEAPPSAAFPNRSRPTKMTLRTGTRGGCYQRGDAHREDVAVA